MGLLDTLQSTFSSIPAYAQQNIISPISSTVSNAYNTATSLIAGRTPQNQVIQQQQQSQFTAQQSQVQQQQGSSGQQVKQLIVPSSYPREIVPTPTSITTSASYRPSTITSPSPVVITPPQSFIGTITKGMTPVSPTASFGGRMSGFLGNVGQGVKNIYELPVQGAFQQIEKQKLAPIIPTFQAVSDIGKGFRETETGKFIRSQLGYGEGVTMTPEKFEGGIKTLEKAGAGLVAGVPQSFSETMLAPGKIIGHGVEGKLSQEDITTGASFGMGLIFPTALQGGGMALRGIGTKVATKLGASELLASKSGYIAEKIPEVGGLILGGIYAKDVYGRMTTPIESGEFTSRPSTEKEIADYLKAHPNETFTGKEEWNTPVPVMKAPSDMDYYRRGVAIGSSELVPMSFGAMLSPKFGNVKLPTESYAKIEKITQEIYKLKEEASAGKITPKTEIVSAIPEMGTAPSLYIPPAPKPKTLWSQESQIAEKIKTLTSEAQKIAKAEPSTQKAWSGLTTPEGSIIFGKTPEGFKFGTPKFKEATVKELYTPALTGEEGYLPVGKTELELAQKNVMPEYTPETQKLIGLQLELRGLTYGTKSAFIKPELSIAEVTKSHGLKPETTKNIINWMKKQSDIKVEGSLGQTAQMKASRGIHDIDIKVPDKLKATEQLLALIEKTEGKGVVVRKSPTTAGLSTKKGGTLFDIHDIAQSPEEALYSSSQATGNMLKFGFKAEPIINIGGIKTQALSEQATAKMGSTIMLRKPLSWGGTDLQNLKTLPEVSPDVHRAKDIVDIFKIEPTLIESQKKGAFAFLKTGKIERAETLAKDIEKTWTERVNKYNVIYESRDLGSKKTTMKSDFEKTMKKYAEGSQPKETIYSKSQPKEKTVLETIRDYGSKASKVPKVAYPSYTSPSSKSKSSKMSIPSRISGYDLLSIDMPTSKPSSKSRVSKPSDLLSLSYPTSKSYESKSTPSDISTPSTPKPSEISKPSKPSEPSPSTPSYPSGESPYIPPSYPPYSSYTLSQPPSDTYVGRPSPPVFEGSSGLDGWLGGTYTPTGKRLKLHHIPSPQELMGFGQAIKSKRKERTKSILEMDI